jgi:hypothetical protein
MPILENPWPNDRITAAPTGSANAQSGHVVGTFLSRRVSASTDKIIPPVPNAICHVSISPRIRMPNTAPNNGDVALNVAVNVGPRCRIAATERFADKAGRTKPNATKINVAGIRKFETLSKKGAASQ